MSLENKVATCLLYDGQAEAAAQFHVSLIPGSEITNVLRMVPDQPAVLVEFTLGGMPYQALNGPSVSFTEAASISVTTPNQVETDRLWSILTADGGVEGQCGWVKDKYGLWWQIVPEVLPRLFGDTDREAAQRALSAMMTMRKIDIATVEAAFNGQ